MAKISDDIREWCDDAYSGRKIRTTKDLYAIADLIDREMVELPKDRDGVTIRVGDTVWGYMTGRKMTVTTLSMMDSGWYVFTDNAGCVKVSHLTHAQFDSLESIADELEEWSEDNRVNGDHEVFDRARDFSERVRKMAKREGRFE